MIVALCIGVFASLVALALFAVSLLRSDREGAETIGLVLAALSAPVALLVTFWGCWELVSGVLGTEYLSSHPLQWAFWIAMGLSDLGSGLAILVNGGLLLVVRGAAPEKKHVWRQRRRALAFALPVLAVVELVTSVVYFVY